MTSLAAATVILAALIGALLTALTLPGVWLALLVALLCKWWQPELISWWTLGVATGIALLGEVIEFIASAVGATRAGGGRAGAGGALIGAFVGAIIGTFLIPVPVAGTILGAALGAGIGAIAGERGVSARPWKEAMRIGHGAAVGRVVATLIKTALALVVAGILIVAVLV